MGPIVLMLVIGYGVLGATCVCWRASRGPSPRPSDVDVILMVLLWPVWFIGIMAARYGWSRRG